MQAYVSHTATSSSSPAKLALRHSAFHYSWFGNEAHPRNNSQSVRTSYFTLPLGELILISKASRISWCYCGFPVIGPLQGPASRKRTRTEKVKWFSCTWPSLAPTSKDGNLEVYPLLAVHSKARLSREPHRWEAHSQSIKHVASLPFLNPELPLFTDFKQLHISSSCSPCFCP